jgi:hypothetical protein
MNRAHDTSDTDYKVSTAYNNYRIWLKLTLRFACYTIILTAVHFCIPDTTQLPTFRLYFQQLWSPFAGSSKSRFIVPPLKKLMTYGIFQHIRYRHVDRQLILALLFRISGATLIWHLLKHCFYYSIQLVILDLTDTATYSETYACHKQTIDSLFIQ